MTTINISLPPIWQAESQQQIYRALLTAFSYPGRVQSLAGMLGDGAEEGLADGAWDALAATLATMVDGQVPYVICPGLVNDEFERFMSGRKRLG